MASTDDMGIDLNDPTTLALHNQILLFKSNPFEDELLFRGPDKSRQRALQYLAHRLDLECEYALATRTVKITRPVHGDLTHPEPNYNTSPSFNPLENVGGAFEDILDSSLISLGSTLGDDLSFEMPHSEQDAPLCGIGSGEARHGNNISSKSSHLQFDSFFSPGERIFQDCQSTPIQLDPASFEDILLQDRNFPETDHDLGIQSKKNCDGDWARQRCSPPLTPVFIHPTFFVSSSNASETEEREQESRIEDHRFKKSNIFNTLETIVPASSQLSQRLRATPEQDISSKPTKPGRVVIPPFEENSKKRKNTERSVSPTYWESRLVGFPPNTLNSVADPTSAFNPSVLPTLTERYLPLNDEFPLHSWGHKSMGTFEPWIFGEPLAGVEHANKDGLQPDNLGSKCKKTPVWQNHPGPLYCPYPGCKTFLRLRFTRKETLDEHTRRFHPNPENPDTMYETVSKTPSSVNSQDSGRGRSGIRSMFSRRSSVQVAANSGYEEIVFDSRSDASGSQASTNSNASCASRRRGPLSDWARAGMKVVKKIGACWRCRFLRKPCGPDDPCALCPKATEQSKWGAVGCHRGTFQSVMHPIVLCPNSFTILDSDYDDLELWTPEDQNEQQLIEVSQTLKRRIRALEEQEEALAQVNRLWKENALQREEELVRIGHLTDHTPGGDLSHQDRQLRQLFMACFPGSRFSPLERQCSPECVPLNECILAIARDSVTPSLECLANLLPRAAAYQADHQKDQLIAQSLICLRTCLEAMHIKASSASPENLPHDQCDSSSCQIECIAQVKANVSLYIEELSRVFFKKWNMLDKYQWWLSAFYGFCIQSFVKKCLMELETKMSDGGLLALREYLQLPIRLFIATSGTFDPLKNERSQHPLDLRDLDEARIAVGQKSWTADGILGSAEYLKSLFAD